jgi:hypothetical protein
MSLNDVLIGFRVVEVAPGTRRIYLPKFCDSGNMLVNNRDNTIDLLVYPNPGGHFVGQGPDVPVLLSAGMRAGFSGVEAPPPGDLYATYRGWGVSKGPEVPG